MPGRRLSVRKIEEVLRLKWERCLSHRKIAASCGMSLGAVNDCVRRAKEAELSWPLPDGLSPAELERRLYPPPLQTPAAQRPLPDWSFVRQELKRKGVSRQTLWAEYREQHPDGIGYTVFCETYAQWLRRVDPRMRQVHKAGEKLFVDYAGQTVPVVHPRTGEVRDARIFVAVLGASDYSYAEPTWTQSLPDWVGSHTRAFAFFGGVPELVVPDNLKSGVSSACHYDPDINLTYLNMARHYGVAVLPARPRKPRDKAKAEKAVQDAERAILAPLRHCTFHELAEVRAAIHERLDAFNRRYSKYLGASRLELFERIEAFLAKNVGAGAP